MNTRTITQQHMSLLNHLASGQSLESFAQSRPEESDHTLTRAIRDALGQIEWLTSLRPQHARAFYKWNAKEDERLLELDAMGSPLWSISEQLMRSKRSVARRLEELNGEGGGA